jgi:hypothetical protein
VVTNPSPWVRQQAAELARTWIATNFGEKPMPEELEDVKVEEAITLNGSVLLGFFTPRMGYYLYWPWNIIPNANNHTSSPREKDLKVLPRTPMERVCIERYNDAVKTLLKEAGDQRAWQEFLASAKAVKQDLEQYREEGGKPRLTVDDEIEIAEALCEDATWSVISELLTESAPTQEFSARLTELLTSLKHPMD